MTLLNPTKEELEEHLKECDHCRHWSKHWKINTWDLWQENWDNAQAFFNSKGNAKTKSKLKDRWYKGFIKSIKS